MIEEKSEIEIIEIDELYHFVKKKTLNCGYGWLLTELSEESLRSNVVVVVSRQERNFMIK